MMHKKSTRRFQTQIAAVLLLLPTASRLHAGEPPPEPGWRQVTCNGCDYSFEVPSFGYPLEVTLGPTGGGIRNFDPTTLEEETDGFPRLLENHYYMDIGVEEPRWSLEDVKEDICRIFPPRPLERPEPSLRCQFDGFGGESTHTDYANVRVGGRAYWLAIDAGQLSRETVDRIFNSLVIHTDSRQASE
ncbi:MAG: hypothetical protein AAGC60_04290 [Acidobacteriota bacterium]